MSTEMTPEEQLDRLVRGAVPAPVSEMTPEEQQSLDQALQVAHAMQQADADAARINAVAPAPTQDQE